MKVLPALVLGVLLGGCALTSKGEALSIRWFTPEHARARITSADAAPEPERTATRIELGRVTSGMHLRDKIAYRDSAFEVGYYDDKRWTERPEVFVRRELSRTLFEERGMRRALAGQAPVVDVEVLAFEEIRGAKERSARVALRVVVHDERTALLEKTFQVDRPVPSTGDAIEPVVQALSEALGAVNDELAAALARLPPPREEAGR